MGRHEQRCGLHLLSASVLRFISATRCSVTDLPSSFAPSCGEISRCGRGDTNPIPVPLVGRLPPRDAPSLPARAEGSTAGRTRLDADGGLDVGGDAWNARAERVDSRESCEGRPEPPSALP